MVAVVQARSARSDQAIRGFGESGERSPRVDRPGGRRSGPAGQSGNGVAAELGAPPRDLGPAVVLLGSAGSPQITAILLDLARRGHLTVWFHHLDNGRDRPAEDVLFERIPGATGDLSDEEAELLERVFSHGDCVAVDTLRRLASRWPRHLVAQISTKIDVRPQEARARPHRIWAAVAVLTGMLALTGVVAAGAFAFTTGLDRPIWLAALVAGVVLASVVADQASRRAHPRRKKMPLGRRMVLYRRQLQQAVEGRDLRTPADYEELLGPHHAWAVALEVLPDWLAVPPPEVDPWAGTRSPFGARVAWVRRASRIPVGRRQATVRVVHRIPQPRKPRD